MTDPVHLFEELRAVKAKLKQIEELRAAGGSYTVSTTLRETWSTGIDLNFPTDCVIDALQRRKAELIEQLKGMRAGILALAKEIADGVDEEDAGC